MRKRIFFKKDLRIGIHRVKDLDSLVSYFHEQFIMISSKNCNLDSPSNNSVISSFFFSFSFLLQNQFTGTYSFPRNLQKFVD